MRIAAIDLGSNTFHLIIAERKTEQLDVIFKINKPIKLSEDITRDNKIIPAAFERGIECLKDYKKLLDDYNVDKIKAVATSAVRSASNGEEFIATAKLVTGIEIETIIGEEEASMIFAGVKASGAIKEKSLIMDIGGGSTEFIFCDEHNSYWKKSFDIGAARLMQRFWKSDPINDFEKRQLNDYLKNTLSELLEYNKVFGATNLIGSAGAFETFIEMIDPSIDIKQTICADIPLNKYRKLSEQLVQSTHAERLELPNLMPLRVDMIVMACILTDYIVDTLNIKEITLSTYDLKYGLLSGL